MTAIDTILEDNVAAAAELLDAATRSGDAWTTPRTSGGWSPAQVVEHVSLTLEQGAAVVSGRPSKFPRFPVLKEQRFPRSRTTTALEPSPGAATLEEADARLQAAVRNFNQACRDRLANGRPLEHPVFGTVSVESYAQFQVLHTRHHLSQLPG